MNAITQTHPDTAVLIDDSPAYDARQLLGSATTARIVLDHQVYTLRLTRSGKLILTK